MTTPPAGMPGMPAGQNMHDLGIEAHVLIYLNPGIAVDDAANAINGVALGNTGAYPGNDFQLIHLHVALGEIDFMADVFCKWTTPRGKETRVIGEWVSAVRQLQDRNGRLMVARTSTAVCMNMP